MEKKTWATSTNHTQHMYCNWQKRTFPPWNPTSAEQSVHAVHKGGECCKFHKDCSAKFGWENMQGRYGWCKYGIREKMVRLVDCISHLHLIFTDQNQKVKKQATDESCVEPMWGAESIRGQLNGFRIVPTPVIVCWYSMYTWSNAESVLIPVPSPA